MANPFVAPCHQCNRLFPSASDLQQHLTTAPEHDPNYQEPPPPVPGWIANGVVHNPSQGFRNKSEGPVWTWFPERSKIRWDVLKTLQRACHPLEELKANKVQTAPYTQAEILGLSRCKTCKGFRKDLDTYSLCVYHPGVFQKPKDNPNGDKFYTCCSARSHMEAGCSTAKEHNFADPSPIILREAAEFEPSPPADGSGRKSRAVALDCEMVGVSNHLNGEVVWMTVVDYVSGATLIDTYIRPEGRVNDWRTRVSGVDASIIRDAAERGKLLEGGWRAARNLLWQYVDAETVIVGHAVWNDLKALRVCHSRIVDSGIITWKACGMHRQWGLRALCYGMLGVDIQQGKHGHDCMEDTLATREVVLWCLAPQNYDKLKKWGDDVAAEEEIRKLRAKEWGKYKQNEKRKEREAQDQAAREKMEKENAESRRKRRTIADDDMDYELECAWEMDWDPEESEDGGVQIF
ncbi:ribonuclease H-like domain-containing protein [Geopyxis carbonaria]|nr:ribonuclease H-like domain-containing protein [Geopyxis carbonaria]